MKIRQGDEVVVIAGGQKGAVGKVKAVLPRQNRVLVKGVNVRTIHKKPSATNASGMVIKEERPIHISNVAIVRDAKKKLGSRIGFKLVKGKKVRVMRQAANKEVK